MADAKSDVRGHLKAKERLLEQQIIAERILWDKEEKQLSEELNSNRQRRENEKQGTKKRKRETRGKN